MCEEQMEQLADISVAKAAIERNKVHISYIDSAIEKLNHDRGQLVLNSERLQRDTEVWAFELMLSMSHRKFCRLMGIKGRL